MRPVPTLVSVVYLVLVGVASAPIFTHPLSPLSGVLVVVLTVPWSIIAAIVQAVSPKASWLGSPAGFVVLTGAEALLNAVILYWIVGHKLTARKRRQEAKASKG